MENLMPSEVARLVLGYLKASGCTASWETFLGESPDLKEYAECVRRGREYPTSIGGRNLLQFLDAGHQVLQCQAEQSGGSSVELVSSLQRVVDQLKSVLSQIHPAQTEGRPADDRRSGDPAYGSGRSSLPADRGRGVRPSDDDPRQTSSVPRGRSSFHPNGDTSAFFLQAVVPPLRFLPNCVDGFDDHPLKTKTKDVEPRFDPPEKDCCTLPLVRNIAPELFPYNAVADFGLSYGERVFANPLSRGVTLRVEEEEEPVRDTGMDLRRKPPDDGRTPEKSRRKMGALDEESRGFEVETGTTASEEIDVEGASRDPSPVASDPKESAPQSESAEVNDKTSESRETQGGHGSPAESVEEAETPAGTEPPPLPSRVPDLFSPRCLLANERSLLPSFTTPIKEARFSPGRFRSPRRKSLIPRRRLLSGNSPSAKPGEDATQNDSNSSEDRRELDPVLEELLNNFPFLEKLADNINRVVGTDVPVEVRAPVLEEQPSASKKGPSSQDLNLPESVVKDILSRTENDPVFEEVLSQMCEKIETSTEVDVMLVTPKCRRTPSSSKRRNPDSPFVTPVRLSASDPDRGSSCKQIRPSDATPTNLMSRLASCCPKSLENPSSSADFNRPASFSSAAVSNGVATGTCLQSGSPTDSSGRQRDLFAGHPSRPETLSGRPSDVSSRREPLSESGSGHEMPSDGPSDFQSKQEIPSNLSSEIQQRQETRSDGPSDIWSRRESPSTPLSDFHLEQDTPSRDPSEFPSRRETPSNPLSDFPSRQEMPPDISSNHPDKDQLPEVHPPSSSRQNPTPSTSGPAKQASASTSSSSSPSSNVSKEGRQAHGSWTRVNGRRSGAQSNGATHHWQTKLPPNLHSPSTSSSPAVSTRTSTCSLPPRKSSERIAGSSTSSPKVTTSASVLESPIKVISRSKEGACISIPDRSSDQSFCNTLADIVDLVLTPNSKATFVAEKEGPATEQQKPTPVLLYATNPASPVLVGPRVILNSSPADSLAKAAHPSDGSAKVARPMSIPVSSKRFPVLQPKGPLPPRPVVRIAKQKPLRRPSASSVQSGRLKQAKQTNPIFNREACISRAMQAARSGPNRGPQGNADRGPARSPQLKTLMRAAASSRRTSNDGHHVRALDFGSEAEVAEDFDLSKTMESIGTSLTGVVQRVLRSSSSSSTNPRKRKVPSTESGTEPKNCEGGSGTEPKRNCKNLSLEGLDVDKFLNAIHKE